MALSNRHEILKSLRASPVILSELVRELEPSALRWRPAAGEWAVIEVIGHMADCDERALARVQRILAEDRPALPAFDPDELVRERGHIDSGLQQQLDRYAGSRRAHVTLLEGLSDAQWRREGVHSEHGPVAVELYETHVANEDVDHLAQIAGLIGRQGRGSGSTAESQPAAVR